MTIGERIKKRREELGLTQEEVAKKCGYKSRSSINKIELSRDLPLRKVEIMADALETTPGVLMGWDEELEHLRNKIVKESLDLITINDEEVDLINSQQDKVNYYTELLSKMKQNFENIDAPSLEKEEIERKETVKKALALYDLYENADPRIKAAVESLLKGPQ